MLDSPSTATEECTNITAPSEHVRKTFNTTGMVTLQSRIGIKIVMGQWITYYTNLRRTFQGPKKEVKSLGRVGKVTQIIYGDNKSGCVRV